MTHPLATWESRIRWLKQQARAAYGPVDNAGYAPILRHPNEFQSPVWPTLKQAFNDVSALAPDFPHLAHNRVTETLPHLPRDVVRAFDDFFAAHDLADFEFLDHGGRAVVFRALHRPTGQTRIARVEAPHLYRAQRPDCAVVLQPFATNQWELGSFAQIKLEVLPEQLPLHKAIRRAGLTYAHEGTDRLIHRAAWYLAKMTNLAYPADMIDRDAEPQNVGISPQGKIRSHDPEMRRGSWVEEEHAHIAALDGVPTPRQIALIYGP